MAIILTTSSTLINIVEEVEKLSDFEQKEILAQIRATRLLKSKRKPIATQAKGVKPLTMAQIDRIKHEARKLYANK